MSRVDEYRVRLRGLELWEPYLLQESGLPGPRANLELAQAVADEGDRRLYEAYIANTTDRAPTNTPGEFLAFCAVVGFGRLLAEGDMSVSAILRQHASDPRWRLREGVALALQRLGDVDMDRLVAIAQSWAKGTRLEQRAAAAALSEPRLLVQARHAAAALEVLDTITASVESATDRRSPAFKTLRQGLGYCWSVVVAALPEPGKRRLEKWATSPNQDVRWIISANLKKARLSRMDAEWVRTLSQSATRAG
ncbi:MAG TPA: hypothetical protein PK954_08955 [Anaerolineales bacterium]|nr:hypothetical protein [Anaerolineales bacterium]HRF50136.1 hypothetical protein [Anaerolineales bacterium]